MSDNTRNGLIIVALVVSILLSAGFSWLTGRLFHELRQRFAVGTAVAAMVAGVIDVAILGAGTFCVYYVYAVLHLVTGFWVFLGVAVWVSMIATTFMHGEQNKSLIEKQP